MCSFNAASLKRLGCEAKAMHYLFLYLSIYLFIWLHANEALSPPEY